MSGSTEATSISCDHLCIDLVYLVPKPYLVLLHPAELLQVKALTNSCSVVLMTLLFQCCVIVAFMLSIMFKTSSAG